METKETKEILKAAVLSEVEKWTDEFESITDGYEFEDRLLQRVRAIGQLMMQKSVGKVPASRKKTSHLFR